VEEVVEVLATRN